MVGELADWLSDVQEFRQSLAGYRRKLGDVERALRKVVRSSGDPGAAVELLKSVRDLSETGFPAFSDYERWWEYWEGRVREVELRFEAELQRELDGLQEDVRRQTGESWLLQLEGSYPRYTVGGLITIDVRRVGRDVRRVADEVRKRVLPVVSRRFESPEEFLRCLRAAYYMAQSLDEVARGASRAEQELRRLHLLLLVAMGELCEGGARKGKVYPLEALGVDLGRCLAAKQLEVGGEELELVQTKYAGDGVRVVYPGLRAVSYGKARFVRRGGGG